MSRTLRIAAIVTLMLVPLTAHTATADVTVRVNDDEVSVHVDTTDKNGASDTCEANRREMPGSCVEVSTTFGVTLYVDNGLVDGFAGAWQESNGLNGLQKTRRNVDGELLPPDRYLHP